MACSWVLFPRQIDWLAPAFTGGKGFTVMVTIPVSGQLAAFVPVTIYVVVVAGVAVGFAQLVHDNPVAGDQE